MTIDKEKLKALAEASRPGEWYSAGDLRYCDDKTGEIHGLHHDDSRFIAAVSPTAILALLAEIERLSPPDGQVSYQQQMEAWKSASSQDLRARAELMIQVEELEAENEALRKDAERYRWLMSKAVHNGTLGIADGWIDFEFKEEAQQAIDAAMAEEAER